MAAPDKRTPPAPDPTPGSNPGYAEPKPRDRDDAQRPDPKRHRDPDDGGLERKPESGSDPAKE